jgi:putative NADH-flavin reductase
MNVTVFGAGGRSGRDVVAEALARGYAVTAVVRRPPEPPLASSVSLVMGDARDPSAVGAALDGADAVISAMGPKNGADDTSYSDAVTDLVRVMEDRGPSRLIVTANDRVLDDRPLEGPFADVSLEHRRAFATLRASGLDWTVIAASMLSNAGATGDYRATVGAPRGSGDIDRSDFSRAVVDALDRDDWVASAVAVAGSELSGA